MPEYSLTARYIFPVDSPPVANGVIVVRDGRIAQVEAGGARTADQDLGNVALLPGFVNAHTHLDLSGLAGQCPPTGDFTGWLRTVVAHRRQRTDSQVAEEIQFGLEQALRSGTTLIGDISSGGQSRSALANAPAWSVLFLELLGLPLERARHSWELAQTWLTDWPASDRCRPGLSPHAPYSVHRQLMQWAAATDLPISIHVAETMAELELLTQRAGPFVSFLDELGVWAPEGLAASWGDVVGVCRDRAAVAFVHGNYLGVDGLDGVDLQRSGIVYCPRTHHAFGHRPHPFRSMLYRGVRVALGTDSLASNPDLDMLAETRFVHQWHPDVPGHVLLRMATLSGAETLGAADFTGSLSVGKSADLIVLPLPNAERDDPHALLWESNTTVDQVMWRGDWVDW